jgi:hypothetical protein
MKPMTKKIVIAMVVIFIVFLAYKMWKASQEPGKGEEQIPESLGGSGTSTGSGYSPPNPTPQTPIDNNTIWALKSPYQQNQRIQWMQYEYNRLVTARIQAQQNTPVWPKISEDGVFGTQTKNAINRLLGKSSASYAQVKNKVDSTILLMTLSDFDYLGL